MKTDPPPTQTATVPKRLLAMCYDSLLLVAVWFLAMAVALAAMRGESPADGNPLMSAYLLLVSFGFFAGFWTHGGQTLGMRAWKLKMQHINGGPISWAQAGLRFVTAVPAWLVLAVGVSELAGIPLETYAALRLLEHVPNGIVFGIGLLWLFLDHRPGNWREKFSRTQVVRLTESMPKTTGG